MNHHGHDAFHELPTGGTLTDNQAAAALGNVAVYAFAFAGQIQRKAAERGIDTDDMFAVAALQHISDVAAEASFKHARDLGNKVRQNAFQHGIPAMYHIMSVDQALEVDGEVRELAFAGAIPPSGASMSNGGS